jgi:hypothetical protein
MTQHCGQPDLGPAGDVTHGRIGAILSDDVTRDCKQVVVIFSGVGPHNFP